MDRASTDGLPRTPVIGPILGRDKGGKDHIPLHPHHFMNYPPWPLDIGFPSPLSLHLHPSLTHHYRSKLPLWFFPSSSLRI